MRNREDDDDLFYYDGFTNPEDVFNWNFKIENTLKDIPRDKDVKYVSSKIMGHASQLRTNLQTTGI